MSAPNAMDKTTLLIQIPTITEQLQVNLFKRFNVFRDELTLCDVIIQCDDGKQIYAHKLILSAISPYFETMFQTSMIERTQQVIKIKSIDSYTMESLIHFAYTSEIIVKLENLSSLLLASNMLCFQDIEKSCVDFLCKSLDLSNCISICTIAEQINCEELYELGTLYVAYNFRQLVQVHSFMNLTPLQIESILMKNEINVSSESEVYTSVIKWINYDYENRIDYLSNLLKHVRFSLMSRKYLMDRVLHEQIIMHDERSRDIVLKALDYHMLPERKIDNDFQVLPRNVVNRTLYVLGGEVNREARNSVASYDFQNKKWHPVTPMLTSRKNVAAVVLEGFLYAVGGISTDGKDLQIVERFDPSTEIWVKVASLKQCKGALAVTVVDGWLFALGGSNGRHSLNYGEQYDPLIDAWSPLPKMRLPRSHFDCTELNGKIYATGGYCGISEVERCECFNPLTNKWAEITGMNKSRMNHGVVTCGNRIYVFGGKNSMGLLNSIEKYSPDLNMWLIIKTKVALKLGMSICLGFKPDKRDSDDVVIVGGIDDKSHHETNEVKTIEIKSPDYRITSSLEMLEEISYAGVAIL